MPRYSYKPLVGYFPGKTPEETEASKYDFIQAYKDSLTSGELLVDLYNYEIYVANNGLEYPVPSTPELKKEIIEWIESDNGPLGALQKNELLNEQTDDPSDSTLKRKKIKLQLMINQVEAYNKACKEAIDADLNKVERVNREISNWYENLASFTKKLVYSKNMSGNEVEKVAYMVTAKYIDLYRRMLNIFNFIKSMGVTTEIDPEDIIENYDKTIKDIFHELVNNQISIESKLDITEIKDKDGYKVPDYQFNVRFKAPYTTAENELANKLTTLKRLNDDSYTNNRFENSISSNNDIITMRIKQKEAN